MAVWWMGRYVFAFLSLFLAAQRPAPKRPRHGHRQRNRALAAEKTVGHVETVPKEDGGLVGVGLVWR